MQVSSRMLVAIALSYAVNQLAACDFPRPADVVGDGRPSDDATLPADANGTTQSDVGGTVHGLWTGADAVALRLISNGSSTLHSVQQNGAFSFPVTLAAGDSYVVEIASSPTKHSCSIASGANGVASPRSASSIEVACRGPAISITFSAPDSWNFDPTHDTQAIFDASVLLQEIILTIDTLDGLLVSAMVGGTNVAVGTPSAPRLLPLGTTAIDVDLTAQGGLSKSYQIVIRRGQREITQAIYAKASNASGVFGVHIAISGDTLVVGATAESSSATGVNGNQTDTSAPTSGAVYVFRRSGNSWAQEAYIKASNTEAGDHFGASVALSGNTLVVGAPDEDSGATGVNGNQADNNVQNAGAVYVFQRTGSVWTQQAYIKPLDTEDHDQFGGAVAISNGTFVVGAVGESSSSAGVDGDPSGRTANRSGAVYVFQRISSSWVQQAYIKASNTQADDFFGYSVAISGDTLAVAALLEDSSARSVNGDQFNNDALNSGAVYIFQRAAGAWAQQAYVKASNTGSAGGVSFGGALSIEGDTLAVGGSGDNSGSTGVNGNQMDTSASGSGAVYVFQRNGATWAQQAYIKASNTERLDSFGAAVAFSGDILVVGATQESSNAMGVAASQANNDAPNSGAVYTFRRTGTVWMQQAYVKASNTNSSDRFGSSVAASSNIFAVGAPGEQSSATGINGNQNDNSLPGAGAVYVFQ
jgi:hypothetical protein